MSKVKSDINYAHILDVSAIETYIGSLLEQKAELQAENAKLKKRVEELEADNAALEGEVKFTAAEALQEWWSQSNVHGIAEMTGDEMLELCRWFRLDEEPQV